jgi:hypothetical protein
LVLGPQVRQLTADYAASLQRGLARFHPPRRHHRASNAESFFPQGQVCVWLNQEIGERPGLKLDKATQEKPRKSSCKRSDLVVWTDRANEIAPY